ncbi:MAG: TPM domain-containing protein, partial [Methanosarcinales archaeon]|nr:TPM domain-containing protein [Methanosarcinales archaeon]
MTKSVFILLILIMLMPVAQAASYPQLTGFVTDTANMIDPAYETKITELALSIEQSTSVEIAVVTVESFEGESRDMYAVKLFEQAGIGKKDKDNGLLILVSKQDREYRFEVGYGLEGIITDSMKVNIGERIIVPNFRNGDYGKGIYDSMVITQGLLEG